MPTLRDDFAEIADPAVEYVIGIDEAGRGCLAGPVCAAAACFRLRPFDQTASDDVAPFPVGDSKAMSAGQRASTYAAMMAALGTDPGPAQSMEHSVLHAARHCGCCVAADPPAATFLGCAAALMGADVIDKRNILNAALEGMALAAAELVGALRGAGVDMRPSNTAVLIDGNRLPWTFQPPEKQRQIRERAAKKKNDAAIGRTHACLSGLPCRAVVGGDGSLFAVGAASVVAKVLRDAFVVDVMEPACPGYGFADHKGYAVPAHKAALTRLGPSAYHRRTFAPVAALIASEEESAKSGRGKGKASASPPRRRPRK